VASTAEAGETAESIDIDDLCPRCKCCTTYTEECYDCGGLGYHEMFEEDPLWYDEDDIQTCSTCQGKCYFTFCLGGCNEHGQHSQEQRARPPRIYQT
jgi:hypothetical protein